jgi:GTP-binding protein HflX
VDASSEHAEAQIETVHNVLHELGVADGKPIPLVLNKADVAQEVELMGLVARHPGAVVCSAETGDGLDLVKQAVHREIARAEARNGAAAR